MKIIAVNRFYRPDISATSQLLTDLAQSLAASGFEVVVVTSRLRYETGDASCAFDEVLGGVRVVRVWSTRFGRARILARAVDYFTFYISAFVRLVGLARRGDIILAKTDPPLISVACWIAARLRGAKLVNWCQDLFPEIAAALGLGWARGPVGRMLAGARNASLKGASLNVTLSEAMAGYVRAQGVEKDKVATIENWCEETLRPVAPGENALRTCWGLTGRTVIGYSGNLGRAHEPARVAELVRRTLDLPGIVWLFIGGGAGFDMVRAAASDGPPGSVIFRPYQPINRLSESLSAADLHLITLSPPCEALIFPSKYYGVRAVARPALFLGDPAGAVARKIRADDAGVVLDIARPDTWRDGVAEALSRAREAGANGRAACARERARAARARWARALETVAAPEPQR